MKLRRTEKNDLVVGNNSKLSLQNILVITSMLFVLLFFIPVIKVGREYSFSYANMTFGGGSGVGSNIFLFLLLIPAANIALWVFNVKKHNAKNSFKFVMLSYVLSLLMSAFVLLISWSFSMLSKMSSTMMSGLGNFYEGLGDGNSKFFSTNFFGVIYTILALVYVLTAIFGIIFTGDKEVEKGLAAEDFFTKENFNKIKSAASKQVENAKQALDNKGENKNAEGTTARPEATAPVAEAVKEEEKAVTETVKEEAEVVTEAVKEEAEVVTEEKPEEKL